MAQAHHSLTDRRVANVTYTFRGREVEKLVSPPVVLGRARLRARHALPFERCTQWVVLSAPFARGRDPKPQSRQTDTFSMPKYKKGKSGIARHQKGTNQKDAGQAWMVGQQAKLAKAKAAKAQHGRAAARPSREAAAKRAQPMPSSSSSSTSSRKAARPLKMDPKSVYERNKKRRQRDRPAAPTSSTDKARRSKQEAARAAQVAAAAALPKGMGSSAAGRHAAFKGVACMQNFLNYCVTVTFATRRPPSPPSFRLASWSTP